MNVLFMIVGAAGDRTVNDITSSVTVLHLLLVREDVIGKEVYSSMLTC